MKAHDDFYAPRRGEIADTSAYRGFLVGFLGAAPLAWNALTDSFDENVGDEPFVALQVVGADGFSWNSAH